MDNKVFAGTCFIGVSGGEIEYSLSRDSLENIVRRNGDELFYNRSTKGYESRQKHINNFIASKHDFLLLLDADMTYGPGTLERLRSHQLPYVSGFYMMRKFAPMQPVWFQPYDGRWPLSPWIGDPQRQGEGAAPVLHPLGASGWGCLLVHREVILAVRALLKGEWEILEDDMDVWPYDLRTIVQALAGLQALVDEKPKMSTLLPTLAHHLGVLQAEIRPLLCTREMIGSDIRFPFYALHAGYQLMGDPDVRAGHVVHYPINPDDWSQVDAERMAEWAQSAAEVIEKMRQEADERKAAVLS